jgi:D-aminopeptidase
VPVGSYLTDLLPCHDTEGPITQQMGRRCSDPPGQQRRDGEDDPGGSIIIVVATDAPLLPHQLDRIANRTAMGLARMGSIAGNTSGDLALAFSTANPGTDSASGPTTIETLPNSWLNPLFEATIQATEEAILNSLIGAETMVGADYVRVQALPHDRLREILRRYNRLAGQR